METVIYERQNEVGVIRLNRPDKLNALTEDMLRKFLTTLEVAREDTKVRVVVLKGEGRAFCAGTDISDLAVHRSIEEHRQRRLKDIQEVPHALIKLGKPIIAAIHGYAVGAGFEISLYCDIRIVAENAKLGSPEAKIGGTVTTGCTYMLPRLIGMGKAKEMLLLGEFVDAKEAERIGLVNKVVPLEDLDKEAMAMAKKIASLSPLSVQLMRSCLDSALGSSLDAALQAEIEASCLSVVSGDREIALPAHKKKG